MPLVALHYLPDWRCHFALCHFALLTRLELIAVWNRRSLWPGWDGLCACPVLLCDCYPLLSVTLHCLQDTMCRCALSQLALLTRLEPFTGLDSSLVVAWMGRSLCLPIICVRLLLGAPCLFALPTGLEEALRENRQAKQKHYRYCKKNLQISGVSPEIGEFFPRWL